MTTTISPPAPADEPEADRVDLTKPTDQAPADAGTEEAGQEASRWTQVRAASTAHVARAYQRTRAWVNADAFTDEQWLTRARTAREKKHADQVRQLRSQTQEVQRQLGQVHLESMREAEGDRAAARELASEKSAELRARFTELRDELELLTRPQAKDEQLPITDQELTRVRVRTQVERGAAVVGAVVGGGIVLPVENPLFLALSLPAMAVALWRVGLQPKEPETGTQAPAADRDQAVPEEPPVAGPGFAAAIVAARMAAEQAATPGAAAARDVAAAAEQAAQIQGSGDLLDALVRAGIINQAELLETHLVGPIRPDGPGWRARIDLPRGRPAEHAIGRSAELASALRVKTSQVQLATDTAEDAHEGRITLWVADQANPFAGPPVLSELLAAESWDFWQQGIPLGVDARGIRRILSLIWYSLMIGGLMGYGKTYLARLIASAAALDPYVNIVLISGKSSADWASLKLVAREYIVGNSASAIRVMHETMEELIEEMDAHGKRLEALFESDPKACPEGKVTPALAHQDGLGLTLLVVDELQEILDAAATIKLISADDMANWSGEGNGPKGSSGKTVMVSHFARFIRVARAVGGMAVIITQRPDASSVPTEIREVCAKRASYRVKGINSSKMVLGDDAVAAGAAPHLITETQRGVLVLDEGAEEGHTTLKADLINLDEFRTLCERGRALRLAAGTLRGQAAARWERERETLQRRQVLADAVAAMDAHGVDRARLVVLAAWMAELSPEFWHDLTEADLGSRLRAGGAGNTSRIGSVDGVVKASGYTREQLAAALSSPAA